MERLVNEARELAEQGVKELILVAAFKKHETCSKMEQVGLR